jgi:hypothetical protein
MATPITLPTGLIYHCDACKLAVPSDAPKVDRADCAFIAKHRLAWFNPAETPAGQHVMAVAAWALIHDPVLKAGEPTSTAYSRAYHTSRKAHFTASAVRKAMTPEQVTAGLAHKRDGVLYR